ncbi:response regulator [Rhodococcoides kyotonense]|uniref:DNA-binding response regulator, NarL/FixJ family, contains REC and HTH domains n=1 Tax=Rhodococcoides kyotonense TaxID=398843 RepID=A0A239IVR9_9NOCA|nr:response regulator transcription factor [Rhodococcus kyotonensis]SNS97707.1 DNA-binding response regulator, NarL/FixJ family, contains REC and HTH domains [Rhodococcus kyotonensis]
MTTPGIITVLVVDDDRFVRRGVADIFAATTDIRVVADVDDGDQVLQAVSRFRPHVVLMDLKMKRVGGLEATTELMKTPHPPRVIAMTALDVDDLVVRAVTAGAHSFVSKDEAPETFHLSVRAVAAGNTLFSEDALRRIVASQNPPARPVSPALNSLTDREREVLRIMASGATTATISKEMFLSETTVKTHISGIFTKLGVNNRVEAALSAFRAGWVT